MRTMIRSVLVSVLLGFLTVVAAQRTPSCEEWNTKEYFQTAALKEVTTCLDNGADPKAEDRYEDTPLHRAANYNDNPAVIQALIAAGADPKARNAWEDTPLHGVAQFNENLEAIEVLIAAGADPKARGTLGRTPLHWAANDNENPAVIKALLAAGGDLMARDYNKDTPLHLAAMFNANPAVLKALLAAGADPMARDEHGNTPLHAARNPAVLKALLAAGADPMARDKYGNTPLHEGTGNPAVMEVLLAGGAKLEARNEIGSTPLHAVAGINNPAGIEVLLAAGAKLEARDEDGNTPLHWAAEYVSIFALDYLKRIGVPPHAGGAIEALLDAGADPMARNAAGETPWDLAKGNKALKGSDAYWRLNEARFEAPGRGARGSPTTGPTSTSDKSNVELAAAVPSSGPGCMIAGYPSPPGGVANLGFSWCPASVTLQVRSFALQAAGAQCAIATGSSSTPEQINARRQEINAACDRLAALGARLDGPNSGASCRCPAGFGP